MVSKLSAQREEERRDGWSDPLILLCSLYYFGSSHSGEISMNAFYIDQYPVTNAAFKQFLAASNYKPADPHNFLLVPLFPSLYFSSSLSYGLVRIG
jgi:hypothetical protein